MWTDKITSGKIVGPQKVVVYGPEGIGKSTFASKFPSPLFIDTEGSTKLLNVSRFPSPSSWTMMMESLKDFLIFLKDPSGREIFRTLIIDTADWAEQLCMSEICDKAQKTGIEDFGYGKGYIYLVEEFGRFLNLLGDVVEKGVNVVLVAHAQMRKFEQPDEMGSYDRWELKLQKKTASLVKEWADMVLFANFKTYVVNVDGQGVQKGKNKAQGNKRVMYTTHHQCWDAKNRHALKDELPFDFAEIAGVFSAVPASASASAAEAAPPTEPTPEMEIPISEPPPLVAEPASTPPSTPPQQIEDIPNASEPPDVGDKIPRPLRDLMEANGVGEDEIQMAVGGKGYYPYDTPISNYAPDFVTGVLVGAWEQVFQIIQKDRAEMPFK